MRANIDKYTAVNKLEVYYTQIEHFYNLDYNNEEFQLWRSNLINLLEDIFSKESRQYNEFERIKFHPGMVFLSAPENEQLNEKAFKNGLQSSKLFLTNLISYIKEMWNITLDYENIKAIKPNIQDDDFEKLAKSIRENLENSEPEIAMDHLHTFLIKYFRQLNFKYAIEFTADTPLNSLFGSYVKYLIKEEKLELEISPIILKYSISIFEKYNDIRNNRSFAHDNKILGYSESKFIFNNISNLIQYINSIENK